MPFPKQGTMIRASRCTNPFGIKLVWQTLYLWCLFLQASNRCLFDARRKRMKLSVSQFFPEIVSYTIADSNAHTLFLQYDLHLTNETLPCLKKALDWLFIRKLCSHIFCPSNILIQLANIAMMKPQRLHKYPFVVAAYTLIVFSTSQREDPNKRLNRL